jgi:hypothetical protein
MRVGRKGGMKRGEKGERKMKRGEKGERKRGEKGERKRGEKGERNTFSMNAVCCELCPKVRLQLLFGRYNGTV